MRVFDEIAAEWDCRNRHPRIPPGFLELMPKGAVVLDAGCGNGRNVPALLSRASKVYCLDSSSKLLGFAKRNLEAEAAVGRVAFCRGRMQALPYAGGLFDAVYCFNAFHHLRSRRDRARALGEFRRVLKPGGNLAISVWNKLQPKFSGLKADDYVGYLKSDGAMARRYYHFFNPGELAGLLEFAGFDTMALYFEKAGRQHGPQGADNLCAASRLARKPHAGVAFVS